MLALAVCRRRQLIYHLKATYNRITSAGDVRVLSSTTINLRARIKSSLGGNMWLRYAALAPYRTLCALGVSIGGATSSGHHSDLAETGKYVERIFNEYK